jgi:hypothetical protein
MGRVLTPVRDRSRAKLLSPRNERQDILREPPSGRRDQKQESCWSCGKSDHFRGNLPYEAEGRNKERRRRRDDRRRSNKREPARKKEWHSRNERETHEDMTDPRETSRCRGKGRTPVCTLTAPSHFQSHNREDRK